MAIWKGRLGYHKGMAARTRPREYCTSAVCCSAAGRARARCPCRSPRAPPRRWTAPRRYLTLYAIYTPGTATDDHYLRTSALAAHETAVCVQTACYTCVPLLQSSTLHQPIPLHEYSSRSWLFIFIVMLQ